MKLAVFVFGTNFDDFKKIIKFIPKIIDHYVYKLVLSVAIVLEQTLIGIRS